MCVYIYTYIHIALNTSYRYVTPWRIQRKEMQRNAKQNCTALHCANTKQYNMIEHSTARHSTAQRSAVVRYDTTQYDKARQYTTVLHCDLLTVLWLTTLHYYYRLLCHDPARYHVIPVDSKGSLKRQYSGVMQHDANTIPSHRENSRVQEARRSMLLTP